MFGNVISIEIDSNRYDNLVHNLNQYKFTNVETLNGDSLLIIPILPIIDIIFVDVPWGGKDYKLQKNLRLNFGTISLEKFIINCFDKNITKCPPKLIISKIPKNYDIQYLYEILSSNLYITLYELKKMNIIAIEKKEYIKCQLIKDIEKISINLINEIINTAVEKINQINTTNLTNLTNMESIEQRQQWDSTEDFCINAPNKKTNILQN